MREIKFRAWDKTYERFVQIDTTYYLNRDGEFDTTMFADEKGISPVLLQSTGLFDKDGIAIYEGDIVSEIYTSFGKVEKDTPFVVMFGNQEFADGNYEEHCIGYNLNPEIRYEIIGNIYENPELLK